ncbi:MAG: alanine--tRNA ligase [Bacteroidetes bacterium]|nr:MAG: alanine--tRNA ligase [Bacteroidota bacterium]
MTSAQIRQAFLDFFAEKGHTVVPSAPIVVKNDPTLLFTNAGMNQFKDYFLGNQAAPYRRATDTQKCLRVSGKHNDLEEVGVDHYHHTMFEMLGNWSFGDYFKAEAIAWSWELLTSVYGIAPDRLYATVFEGDRAEKIPPSKIALAEWQKLLPSEQIVFGNKKDNFWEMGDTGPCGPCTEIHVDMRSDAERAAVPGYTLVNKDHPEVIEIWNNVFIQYNRKKDGSLEDLPSRHVDTGMGLERLVRVLQGKKSNYDTDIFSGTIAAIERLTGQTYDRSASKQAVAFRVLADHIRAIIFCIADGQLPSNTGAGYVIRRILRRAVRYYYSYLHQKEPLLHLLVPVLAKQFETVFPELFQQADFVSKVVLEEEHAFLRTLDGGLKRIEELLGQTVAVIDGDKAFELYDTYGFPLDLTELIAAENNKQVDHAGFDKAMQLQKNRSRAATALETGDWVMVFEGNGDGFVGYNLLTTTTQVLRYRKVSAKGKSQYQLVLAATPFYAESGGQMGDTGLLHVDGQTIAVTDTKKENDLIVHFVDELPDNPAGAVEAVVNAEVRLHTMHNHTATHLLQAALQQVLGKHVAQKGSLVSHTQLRFDFSHFSKVTDQELRAIENIVNQRIRENLPVVIATMPKADALALGATALFGEKYGDVVRVVTIDPNFSVELCGGTHVMQTGMIGLFTIASELAVAAGVRRIEALTGPAAFAHLSDGMEQLKATGNLLKTKDVLKAVDKLAAENASLKKQIEGLETRQLAVTTQALLQQAQAVGSLQFVGEMVEVSSPDLLKRLCFDVKNLLPNGVVVLAADIDGKPFVAVGIADNVVAERGLDAGSIIKQHIAPLIKGGGGGQKGLATAGGQNVAELHTAIDAVKKLM